MNVYRLNLRLCVFVMLSVALTFPVKAQSNALLDSLYREAVQIKELCKKAAAYNELTRAYISINLQKSTEYVQEGIRISKAGKCQKALGDLYNTASIVKINDGNNSKAFAYIDSSLEVHTLIGNTVGKAAALGNKGTLKIYVGKYDEALKLQYESLKLYEELGDKSGVATTLTNIFGVYLAQKDYPRSLEIGFRAYSMFDELGETDGKALMSFNIATVYLDTKELDSCSYYADKSESLFKQINQREGIADCYRLHSDILRVKGQFNESINLLQSAIAVYDSIGSVHKQIQSLSYLASVYYSMKDYRKSIAMAEEFMKLSKQHQIKQFQRDAAKHLLNNYKALGQFENALLYSEMYRKLEDEILNENTLSEINRLKSNYETERQEREFESVKQQKQLLEYDLGRKNNLLIISIVLILFLLTVTFFIFKQRRLVHDSKTIQLEQRLLRAQMNPHFIFNSLTAIQSFVYKSEPKEAGKFLSSFAALIRIILDNSREEFISLSKEISWLEKYLQLQLLRFENRFTYTLQIDKNLNDLNIQIPPMLTQPFIENALEHGLRDIDYPGEVSLCFSMDKNNLLIQITDNGRGIGNSTVAVDETHISHAMEITKERLILLNRNRSENILFRIQALPMRGTFVEFCIPINHKL